MVPKILYLNVELDKIFRKCTIRYKLLQENKYGDCTEEIISQDDANVDYIDKTPSP